MPGFWRGKEAPKRGDIKWKSADTDDTDRLVY